MYIFFGKIVTWIAAAVLTVWTAKKTLLLVTFISFLGVALYGVFLHGVEDILGAALEYIGDAGSIEGTIEYETFTGLIGWFLDCFKIPECLAIMVDIVILKWTLRKIPIIKW